MKPTTDDKEKISLLLVDDHQMLLDLWTFILMRDGRFDIIGKATNGKQAIEIAKTKRPSVALVDINIGEPDGLEVTRMIRRYSMGTKVIGVSMYTLPAYAKRMKALGASGYVTKSSPAAEIVTSVIEVYNNRSYYCKQIKDLMNDEVQVNEADKADIFSLTRREIEIIRLIENGFSTRDIAEKLYLSPNTVHIHRHNIFKKLKVKNVSSLIKILQQ